MIAIVNVSKNRTEIGKHIYEIRINMRPVCRFEHYREDPLDLCLRRAADAVEVVREHKFMGGRTTK